MIDRDDPYKSILLESYPLADNPELLSGLLDRVESRLPYVHFPEEWDERHASVYLSYDLSDNEDVSIHFYLDHQLEELAEGLKPGERVVEIVHTINTYGDSPEIDNDGNLYTKKKWKETVKHTYEFNLDTHDADYCREDSFAEGQIGNSEGTVRHSTDKLSMNTDHLYRFAEMLELIPPIR